MNAQVMADAWLDIRYSIWQQDVILLDLFKTIKTYPSDNTNVLWK